MWGFETVVGFGGMSGVRTVADKVKKHHGEGCVPNANCCSQIGCVSDLNCCKEKSPTELQLNRTSKNIRL